MFYWALFGIGRTGSVQKDRADELHKALGVERQLHDVTQVVEGRGTV